jgi:hypothetical protein
MTKKDAFTSTMTAHPFLESACCFLGLLFDPVDEGTAFVQNVGKRLPDYNTQHLEDSNLQNSPHLMQSEEGGTQECSPLSIV